jgi:carboxyl-terminal processing protease
MFTFGSPEDFQLQQAINYLDGKPVQKAVARPKAVTAAQANEGTVPKAVAPSEGAAGSK